LRLWAALTRRRWVSKCSPKDRELYRFPIYPRRSSRTKLADDLTFSPV